MIAKKPKMAIYTFVAVVLIAAVAVGCTFTGAEKPTKRVEIFSDGTITITVSEEYAEQLYVDSLYSDDMITMIANIYYKPDYAVSDVYTTQTCGGWIMSVLSYPDDPMEDMSKMASGIGTEYKARATDGKRVYIEEYPMDGEYHYREHPENTQIYETILESLQIDYGNLDSYSAPSATSDIEATPEETLALSYLLNENPDSGERIYFANHTPDAPQENDYRIDSMLYAGETRLYESVGVAYRVSSSRYGFTRNESMEKIYGWQAYDPFYIVLRRNGYGNTWDDVLGRTFSIDQAKSIEDVILEVAYSLQDIEVSLSFDGYPQLVGPFSAPNFFRGEATLEILEGWEPIYNEGDDWIRYQYDGLTATCYRNAAENSATVYNIETTRSDVATRRGLRIGATRNEVLAAYPDIYDVPYWDREGDYLWYCSNEDGWGAALLFWFENNQVVKIELNSMFD